jgi:DNA (cytosine-5)-methyltransferase 1
VHRARHRVTQVLDPVAPRPYIPQTTAPSVQTPVQALGASVPEPTGPGAVVELFAGVGGFRLGLEGEPQRRTRGRDWRVVWSNQWEPGTKVQDASSNYVHRFGEEGHVSEDIAKFLDWAILQDEHAIPDEAKKPVPKQVDLLVGGFPCQDYSVAKPLSQSAGIAGQKGVLWWEINRFLEWKKPKYVLLENVDRLLKSPTGQRGRDFAVMLSCFQRLGYQVQWRVINAADYGFPQRRRRVFILAERTRRTSPLRPDEALDAMVRTGTLARAFPVLQDAVLLSDVVSDDPYRTSEGFGHGLRVSPWQSAGVMRGGVVHTARVEPNHRGRSRTLGDALVPDADVPPEFFIPMTQEPTWVRLKGAKKEERVDKRTGFEYFYSEGGIAYPDPVDRPSRTILTGEGGTSASRFKHVVQGESGRLRRLVPEELEYLQGFPKGWTAMRHDGKPISDGRRAFFMGNALVVGVVERIGKQLAVDRRTGASTI